MFARVWYPYTPIKLNLTITFPFEQCMMCELKLLRMLTPHAFDLLIYFMRLCFFPSHILDKLKCLLIYLNGCSFKHNSIVSIEFGILLTWLKPTKNHWIFLIHHQCWVEFVIREHWNWTTNRAGYSMTLWHLTMSNSVDANHSECFHIKLKLNWRRRRWSNRQHLPDDAIVWWEMHSEWSEKVRNGEIGWSPYIFPSKNYLDPLSDFWVNFSIYCFTVSLLFLIATAFAMFNVGPQMLFRHTFSHDATSCNIQTMHSSNFTRKQESKLRRRCRRLSMWKEGAEYRKNWYRDPRSSGVFWFNCQCKRTFCMSFMLYLSAVQRWTVMFYDFQAN